MGQAQATFTSGCSTLGLASMRSISALPCPIATHGVRILEGAAPGEWGWTAWLVQGSAKVVVVLVRRGVTLKGGAVQRCPRGPVVLGVDISTDPGAGVRRVRERHSCLKSEGKRVYRCFSRTLMMWWQPQNPAMLSGTKPVGGLRQFRLTRPKKPGS